MNVLRLVQVCTLVGVCAFPGLAPALEIYDKDGNEIDFAIAPTKRLPILFVHGHAPDSVNNPNYRRNFWDDTVPLVLAQLTSFKIALSHNPDLDIEAYYIRFADHAVSIEDDAREIADAVDLIIARHNPAYAAANPNLATTDPAGPPPVQLVIIGYSKGTISTRLYLKALVQGDPTAPQPRPARPNFRPVSEFIAVSPPNHGIALAPLLGDPFDNLGLLPVQQLYNGVTPANGSCGQQFDPVTLAGAENFIERLNGETGMALTRGARAQGEHRRHGDCQDGVRTFLPHSRLRRGDGRTRRHVVRRMAAVDHRATGRDL